MRELAVLVNKGDKQLKWDGLSIYGYRGAHIADLRTPINTE